jgi:acylphosphatase
MPAARLTAWVEGRVQGVGFRWWVRSRALQLGLTGFAENLTDGRVKVVAEGADEGCRELLALLEAGSADGLARREEAGSAGRPAWPEAGSANGSARPGRVSRVTHRWGAAEGTMAGFRER